LRTVSAVAFLFVLADCEHATVRDASIAVSMAIFLSLSFALTLAAPHSNTSLTPSDAGTGMPLSKYQAQLWTSALRCDSVCACHREKSAVKASLQQQRNTACLLA